MQGEININADSIKFSFDFSTMSMRDKSGDIFHVCLLNDESDFIKLIGDSLKSYRTEARELIEKIKSLTKNAYGGKPKAVYLGKKELLILRVNCGFSVVDWDQVLGIPIVKVEKESYFDIKM